MMDWKRFFTDKAGIIILISLLLILSNIITLQVFAVEPIVERTTRYDWNIDLVNVAGESVTTFGKDEIMKVTLGESRQAWVNGQGRAWYQPTTLLADLRIDGEHVLGTDAVPGGRLISSLVGPRGTMSAVGDITDFCTYNTEGYFEEYYQDCRWYTGSIGTERYFRNEYCMQFTDTGRNYINNVYFSSLLADYSHVSFGCPSSVLVNLSNTWAGLHTIELHTTDYGSPTYSFDELLLQSWVRSGFLTPDPDTYINLGVPVGYTGWSRKNWHVCELMKNNNEDTIWAAFDYARTPAPISIGGVEFYQPLSLVAKMDYYVVPSPCFLEPGKEMLSRKYFVADQTIDLNTSFRFPVKRLCDGAPAFYIRADTGEFGPDYKLHHDIRKGNFTVPIGFVVGVDYVIDIPDELEFYCDYGSGEVYEETSGKCRKITGVILDICHGGELLPNGTCHDIIYYPPRMCDPGYYYDIDAEGCVRNRCDELNATWVDELNACGVRVPYSKVCEHAPGEYDIVSNKCKFHIGTNAAYESIYENGVLVAYDFYQVPFVCNASDLVTVAEYGNVDYYCMSEPQYDCIGGTFFYTGVSLSGLYCMYGAQNVIAAPPGCPLGTIEIAEGMCFEKRVEVVTRVEYQNISVRELIPVDVEVPVEVIVTKYPWMLIGFLVAAILLLLVAVAAILIKRGG